MTGAVDQLSHGTVPACDVPTVVSGGDRLEVVGAVDRDALDAALAASRGILRVRHPEEAVDLVVTLVRRLGGRPVRRRSTLTLPEDLSLGQGAPLYAAAEPGSPARARLAVLLPPLVADAQLALRQAGDAVRLARDANLDPLTALFNRRSISRLLPRLAVGDVVAMFDLDDFKAVNDRWGHTVGDEVLVAFGRLLRENGRGEDRYARFGGDEFVAVYRRTAPPDAVRLIERLGHGWLGVRPRPVTFSAGVAAVGPDRGEAALRAADAALYAAKQAGRDRIEVA